MAEEVKATGLKEDKEVMGGQVEAAVVDKVTEEMKMKWLTRTDQRT